MADFDSTSLSLAEPETPEVSTQIDAGKPADPGQAEHKEPEEEKSDKPESRLDAIKRAAEDVEKNAESEKKEKPEEPVKEKPAKEEKADDEPDQEAKPEPKRKASLKDLPEEERKAIIDKMPPDQRRRYELSQITAPEKFVPTAKEVWANVPGEVKGEIQRVMKEHEAEVTQAREFIAPLIKYHQMAQQQGTTVHEAMERYVGMENALRTDPAQGFKSLLENMQMKPEQAIAQILRAYGASPQQLANSIAQNPQAFMAQAPQQPQQPPEDPRISQLQQQLQQQQADLVRQTVVEPFKQTHPRYNELEPYIASFLQSDMVPASLSLPERLEVAYDMAARINPASASKDFETDEAPAPENRAVAQDLGGKSVRGAPSSGTDTSGRRKRNVSRGDAIEMAMSELGIT